MSSSKLESAFLEFYHCVRIIIHGATNPPELENRLIIFKYVEGSIPIP